MTSERGMTILITVEEYERLSDYNPSDAEWREVLNNILRRWEDADERYRLLSIENTPTR